MNSYELFQITEKSQVNCQPITSLNLIITKDGTIYLFISFFLSFHRNNDTKKIAIHGLRMNIISVYEQCAKVHVLKCLDLFGENGTAVNLARKPGNYGRIELWGPEGINEVISRLWQRSKARSIQTIPLI